MINKLAFVFSLIAFFVLSMAMYFSFLGYSNIMAQIIK